MKKTKRAKPKDGIPRANVLDKNGQKIRHPYDFYWHMNRPGPVEVWDEEREEWVIDKGFYQSFDDPKEWPKNSTYKAILRIMLYFLAFSIILSIIINIIRIF